MKESKTLLMIGCSIMLSGCFETAEEVTARESQFTGQTIAQVSERIGSPSVQNKTKAIWVYKDSYIDRTPIQSFRNGKWITTGYRNQRINLDCTYTANLKSGRIISNQYVGNSCMRFAPRLKKK